MLKTNIYGCIDGLNSKFISGWAYARPGESVVLKIKYLNIDLGIVTANEYRGDLVVYNQGMVGFKYYWNPEISDEILWNIYNDIEVCPIFPLNSRQVLPFYDPVLKKIRGVEGALINANIYEDGDNIEILINFENSDFKRSSFSVHLNEAEIFSKNLSLQKLEFKFQFKKSRIISLLQDKETDGELVLSCEGREFRYFLDLKYGRLVSLSELRRTYSAKSGYFVRIHNQRTPEEISVFMDGLERVISDLSIFSPVYLNGGGLIGAERSRKLIGYDDDIDVALYVGECDSVYQASEKFISCLRSYENSGNAKVKFLGRGQAHIFVKNVEEPIDCFICWAMGGRLYLHWGIPGTINKSHAELAGSTILHGRSVVTFSEPRKVLQALYGVKWLYPDPAFKFDMKEHALRRWRILWENNIDASKIKEEKVVDFIVCSGSLKENLSLTTTQLTKIDVLNEIIAEHINDVCRVDVEASVFLELNTFSRSFLWDVIDHIAYVSSLDVCFSGNLEIVNEAAKLFKSGYGGDFEPLRIVSNRGGEKKGFFLTKNIVAN